MNAQVNKPNSTSFSKTGFLLFVSAFLLFSCKKQSISEAYGQSKPKVVVILGSSTAVGAGATPIDSGWASLISTQLVRDRKNVKIINLAVGGFTTYNILPTGYFYPMGRPKPDTLKNITKAITHKPDLVIINLPTNDVADGYRDDEIYNNYQTLIYLLNQSAIPHIITGTQPRNFPAIEQRSRLKTVNNMLLRNYPEKTVDVLERLSTATWEINNSYNSGDGIHLNNKGHKIIFQAIMADRLFRRIIGY